MSSKQSTPNMLKAELPMPIQKNVYAADQLAKLAGIEENRRTRRGAPRTPAEYVPLTMFVDNSPGEVDLTLEQFQNAIGPNVRGNKRRGALKLYGELLAHFKHLQRVGVNLPRGGNITRQMIAHGLGQVLRDQGCTDLSDEMLSKKGDARKALGKKMDRIFNRIVSQLDADIAKTTKNLPSKD